ncbi:transcription factor Tfb4 [Cucurbitaria berberidis CBS 394.84]|uniref:General transcription and DNA repair factor IIH subunit TFB4 n=1 Tax=Cucurbitaria berberidis CBS 394.84 TaxID=1168544 RepID=A0A9P4L474_9PLEO|nr:transcription factor Tfb4 [Cucurbitaria berberidis CBS 394.84]KAF1841160.1 transcription factor Tfb4 [Cucurbitaria berberidis CBS 394.84]
MNSIDGSNRHVKTDEAPPPSLLAIVLDTNPHAWAHLSSTLPLSAALANILVFINAHLASGNANEVAVIASHSHKTTFLYPTPILPQPQLRHGTANGHVETGQARNDNEQQMVESANKYRPFAVVEQAILRNFSKLLDETTETHLQATPTTLIGGALSLALTYINKSTILHAPTAASAESISLAALADSENTHVDHVPLTSRILIVSVSGDLANQYIPVMNSIFAAQRKKIPIDILKLAGDTVLLQQASDATGGVYMKPERPEGLLQYLMMAFLPDSTARTSLVVPSAGGVDFRAACFCHRNVVDIGFVCSVCLSIFCTPNLPENMCLTCGSYLSLRSAVMNPPALIPRKKKKKKKAGTESATPGTNTPAGSSTPMHP